MKAANQFIAAQLFKDLNNYTVPNFAGAGEILETSADGHTVSLIGGGVLAGAIESTPKGFDEQLKVATNWGNTPVYPNDQIKAAQAIARDEKASASKKKSKDKK